MIVIKVLIALLALFVISYGSTTPYSPTSLTKLDYIAKHPSAALIKTGGRLTERQVEYLAAGGYASIVSVFNFTTTDSSYMNVVDTFPSSDSEINIGTTAGLKVSVVNSQLTVEYATVISDLLANSPKPIYVHCHVGWTATLFTLLHLYRAGMIPAAEIYNQGVALGWNYQSNADAVLLISQFTGYTVTVTGPTLELPLVSNETSYKQYYWTHRVGNDYWYNAGQLLENHVTAITLQGYKTIISFRADGEPTTRLPSDPAQGPVNNYEFSDDHGNYSVEMERKAFEAQGLTFFHLPVTGAASWSVDTFKKYYVTLAEVAKSGVPTIAHCASGYRSAGYIVAFLAYSQKQCTAWALTEARRIGFAFDVSPNDAAVVSFFQTLLKC